MTALSGIIQSRRGTAAQWTSANPTLAAGEAGYETDTGALKMGDGVTAWTALGYVVGKPIAYTPSWSNVTLGSSSTSGRYMRVGKMVVFRADLTTGASFAITGSVQLTLPVTAVGSVFGSQFSVWFRDAGTATYIGCMDISGSTTQTPIISAMAVGGSYATATAISSTVPFVWATTSDQIIVQGVYEAA